MAPPQHARVDLVAHLRALGLKPGALAMIHASVRAVGPVFGGPDEIHHAVLDAVSPGGTTMMFLGCQEGFDDVGRAGVYTPAEEAALLAHQPPFDPLSSRAQREFGVLAEFFRTTPGTAVSIGACSRVGARGARAAWLVADAPWNYGFGSGTPFEKLVQGGGQIVLLGSSYDEVTILHYAEHIADFPDKRVVRYRVPWLQNGVRVWRECEEFNTGGDGIHPNWPHDFFARIVGDFVTNHRGTAACTTGKVGNADAVRIDAAALVRHAIPILQAQAAGRAPA